MRDKILFNDLFKRRYGIQKQIIALMKHFILFLCIFFFINDLTYANSQTGYIILGRLFCKEAPPWKNRWKFFHGGAGLVLYQSKTHFFELPIIFHGQDHTINPMQNNPSTVSMEVNNFIVVSVMYNFHIAKQFYVKVGSAFTCIEDITLQPKGTQQTSFTGQLIGPAFGVHAPCPMKKNVTISFVMHIPILSRQKDCMRSTCFDVWTFAVNRRAFFACLSFNFNIS